MYKRRRIKDTLVGVNEYTIQALKASLASELQAYWLYKRSVGFLKGEGAVKLDEFLKTTAWDELFDHADKLQQRLGQLDGPMMGPLDVIEGESPATRFMASSCPLEMSLIGIISEWEACQMYRTFLENIPPEDPTSRTILEGILKDEEAHLKGFTDICDCIALRDFKEAAGPYWIPVGSSHQALIVVAGNEARVVAWINSLDSRVIRYEEPQADCHQLVDQMLMEAVPAATVPASDFTEMVNTATVSGTKAMCEDVCCNTSCDACCVSGTTGAELVFNPTPETVMDSVVRVTKFKTKAKGVKFVMDSMQEREIDGKKVRVQEFQNAEEANKFLEANKGYVPVDQDDQGKVYVALQSQV